MSTKELIISKLENKSEEDLEKILAYLQQLTVRSQDPLEGDFMAAYLSTLEDRRELYQRLADS